MELWWIGGALFVAAVVMMVFEGRIMRKPESQRSERERRYLAWSRRFGAGYSKVGMKVFPIVLIVLGLVLALLGVPQLAEGHTIGWVFAAMGIGCVVLGIAFLVFAKKRRGPDFWAKHEAANREADQQGRARWFGSPRGAIVAGILFLVSGAGNLTLSLLTGGIDTTLGWISPLMLLLVGGFCLLAGVRQLQQER